LQKKELWPGFALVLRREAHGQWKVQGKDVERGAETLRVAQGNRTD